MRLEKETAIYQLGAIAADIDGATTLAKGKNKIFYQDTAPASGMNEGDLWFKVDSSGGSSLYEYKKTGSNPDTYAWTLRQLGQGSLVAGSVTANEISVNDLAAISANLGSVNVGGVNNEDGVITIKDANDNTVGSWDNTGIQTESTDAKIAINYSSGISVENKTDPVAKGLKVIGANGDYESGMSSADITLYAKDASHQSSYSDYVFQVGAESSSGKSATLGIYHTRKNTAIELQGSVPKIKIAVDADIPIMTTERYVSGTGITEYNLIRNHNNGNISISASGTGLYLGYENTTLIDFLQSAGYINTTELVMGSTNGRYSAMYPSGAIRARGNTSENAWIQAENGANVNAIAITSDSTGTVRLWSRSADGTTRTILERANNSHAITAYGNWTFSNPIVNPSDIRLKENIKDSSVNALDAINHIPMREFDWKEDGHHQAVGIIADELEKVDPGLVRGGGEDENGTPITKGIDSMYLIGYLTKAVQELSAKVEQLEERIRVLEGGEPIVGVD